MKHLILLSLTLLSTTLFAQEELKPLKDLPDFSVKCMDGTFSYDRIMISKTQRTLDVSLNSGYKHAITLNPKFLRKSMSGTVNARLSVATCIGNSDRTLIRCATGPGHIAMNLHSEAKDPNINIDETAQTYLELSQVSTQYIDRNNKLATRKSTQVLLAVSNQEKDIRERIKLNVGCLNLSPTF